MSKFTIFTMIYEDYYMLRQFVESIYNNVDRDSYERILILDDYSNPEGKLREYEKWLENYDRKVKIICFDEFRRLKHYSKDNGLKENLGVGRAFDLSMEYVDTDYLFYADADSIFLKKSKNILNILSNLLDEYEYVQIVGQMRGVEGSDIIEIYKWFNYYDNRTLRIEPNGGDIGPVVAALRMGAFKVLGLKIDSGFKLGATFGYFTRCLMELNKFTALSFPIFTDMYMLHLGGGIIRRLVNDKEIGFIFLKDILPTRGTMSGPRSGGKLHNRFYGRGLINLTNENYINYIKELYGEPFNKIQNSIDENLVYTID